MRIMRASGAREWGSGAGLGIGQRASKDGAEMQTESGLPRRKMKVVAPPRGRPGPGPGAFAAHEPPVGLSKTRIFCQIIGL